MQEKAGIRRIFRYVYLFGIITLGLVSITGIYGCGDSDENNGSSPAVPDLKQISMDQANQLIAFLRRARIQSHTDEMPVRPRYRIASADTSGDEYPISWAMINSSCEERAMAMEYVAASSSFPLPEEPFVIRAEDITAGSVQALVQNPGIDMATINITGPLIMEAAFHAPDGTEISGAPFIFYWPYHKGVVVNVEGDLKVIDLSAGDELIDIDQWAHYFVVESVPCCHMSEEEFIKVKGYWNSMMGAAYEPQDPPERICGYTITPMFTFRWDQEPLVEQLQWTPETMKTQTEAFKSLLSMEYGMTVSDGDAPYYTCTYTAHDTDWLCEYRDPPYCGQ